MVTAVRPQLETAELTGVEILAVGTWNGDQYSSRDLDDIASAFASLKGKIDPPGKLGHDPDQELAQKDGFPAIGWVSNVYRQGKKLLADFTKVPRKVADLIQAGAYDKISSEVYFDREIDGKTYPRVLKAVAFLGADAPAVKDIASVSDVADLYRDLFPLEEAHYADIDTAAARDKIAAEDFAGPHQSFPITTQDQLDAASRLIGHADNPDAVKARAIAIAKRKGFTLPKAWAERDNSAMDPDNDGDDDRTDDPSKNPDWQEDKANGVRGHTELDDDGDEDDAMSELEAFMSKLEDRIKGAAGAKNLRTFLGTARKQLADMKLKPKSAPTATSFLTATEIAARARRMEWNSKI